MKILSFITIAGLSIAIAAHATTDKAGSNADDSAALSELNAGPSVFDIPTPTAYSYSDAKPGYNDRLKRAWEGAPPQIPHKVDEYLPVIAEDNQCLDCHDKPRYIGRPLNKDRSKKNKSPMSKEHYADASLEEIDGARFNCTQCHVPQANAPALVESTF